MVNTNLTKTFKSRKMSRSDLLSLSLKSTTLKRRSKSNSPVISSLISTLTKFKKYSLSIDNVNKIKIAVDVEIDKRESKKSYESDISDSSQFSIYLKEMEEYYNNYSILNNNQDYDDEIDLNLSNFKLEVELNEGEKEKVKNGQEKTEEEV